MTKIYFIELAEYNIWANKMVSSWIDKISDEQWKQPVINSFNSIYETVLHVAGSEKIWFQRFSKYTNFELLTKTFNGSKTELIKVWEDTSQDLKNFIIGFDEKCITEILNFKNSIGIEYSLAWYQMFGHVFNHSTYHRGQMVTMLRQVGFTEISSMD